MSVIPLPIKATGIRTLWQATLVGIGIRPAYQGLSIIKTLQHKFLAETAADLLLEAKGNPQAEEAIMKFYQACIKE